MIRGGSWSTPQTGCKPRASGDDPEILTILKENDK